MGESGPYAGHTGDETAPLAAKPRRPENCDTPAAQIGTTTVGSLMTRAEHKVKFFALMARFNQLGRLLPDPDDLETSDAATAEVNMILTEMKKTQAELDAMMGLPT
jgi:hypothetical protein